MLEVDVADTMSINQGANRMVIYEIKDPGAVVTNVQPKPSRPDLEPAIPVQQSKAIGRLLGGRREQGGHGREGRRRSMIAADDVAMREVQRLIEEINAQLAAQGTMIHLTMVVNEEGVAIDLYDCSDGDTCRCIHDISIDIMDLPILLARLTKKTGIMVDTVL